MRQESSPSSGCSICRAARHADLVSIPEIATGAGPTILRRCGRCGTYWEENLRELHVVAPDQAIRRFPDAFPGFEPSSTIRLRIDGFLDRLRRLLKLDLERRTLLVDNEEPAYQLYYDGEHRLILEFRLTDRAQPVRMKLSDQQHDRWVNEGAPFIRSLHRRAVDDHERAEVVKRERRGAAPRAAAPSPAPHSSGVLEPLPPGTYGIDPPTGAIVAPEGTIAPTTTKAAFLTDPLFVEGDWTNQKAGWYQARTRLLTIGGERLGASVMFEQERMRFAGLWSDDPRFGTGWDDYSLEKEQARDQRHREWLAATLGEWDRPFPWGRIYCGGYDSKDGFSRITVRYEPTPVAAPVLDAYSLRPGTAYVIDARIRDDRGQLFEPGEQLTHTGTRLVPHLHGLTITFGDRTMYLHEKTHEDIVMNLHRFMHERPSAREHAFELLRKHRFGADAELLAELKGAYPGASETSLLEALAAMRKLRDEAQRIADRYRSREIGEEAARAELRASMPGLSAEVYRSAWSEGLSLTR